MTFTNVALVAWIALLVLGVVTEYISGGLVGAFMSAMRWCAVTGVAYVIYRAASYMADRQVEATYPDYVNQVLVSREYNNKMTQRKTRKKEPVVKKDQADRFNEGKAPMHLIPWDVLPELAGHFEKGTAKYGERNWEKGMPWASGVGNSLSRHLAAWMQGEDYDEEGNRHDLAILWNAIILVAYRIRGIGEDDRPKGLTT